MLKNLFHPEPNTRLRDKIAEAKMRKKVQEEMNDALATTPLEKYLLVLKKKKEEKERELGHLRPMEARGFMPNDIIMNSEGLKFLVIDVHGTIRPLDIREFNRTFRHVASAHPEDGVDIDPREEELYDITPEDREKLRNDGII
jgi:hypothetical protein